MFKINVALRNSRVTTLLIPVVKKEAYSPISIRSGSIGGAAVAITHVRSFLSGPTQKSVSS